MNEFDHSHLPKDDGEVILFGRSYKVRFHMHDAARKGDLGRVRQLMEEGVSVDSLNGLNQTPLHLAARYGRYEVAELLINSECDLNLKDICGRTPVMWATVPNREDVCESWILWKKKKDIVDLLLHGGAQVNCADNFGLTLLHLASRTDIVRIILNTGKADLNAGTLRGDTPLMSAAFNGYEEVAALLIQAGADVNRSNRMKWTVLHEAVMGGFTGIVQILLEKEGLHLSPQDDMGDTPLHVACMMYHREAIKLLLEAGADTNMKNNKGRSALSEGIRQGTLFSREIGLFVQKGAFLEDYESIYLSPYLIWNILRDVEFCTQSIVNKFHRQSLPALSSITYFARRLPNVDNFKLKAHQIDEVKNLVKCEIERKTYCNVVKMHPIALSALCVQSLITCQSGKKRAVSPDLVI